MICSVSAHNISSYAASSESKIVVGHLHTKLSSSVIDGDLVRTLTLNPLQPLKFEWNNIFFMLISPFDDGAQIVVL